MLYLLFEVGQNIFDDTPNRSYVYTHIIMYQFVAHPSYVFPGYFWVAFSNGGVHLFYCFADYFEISDDGILDKKIF